MKLGIKFYPCLHNFSKLNNNNNNSNNNNNNNNNKNNNNNSNNDKLYLKLKDRSAKSGRKTLV